MVWSRPTCDVNGILGGYTGKGSKTVLPAQASAKFSFRLVGSQDPDKSLKPSGRLSRSGCPPIAAPNLSRMARRARCNSLSIREALSLARRALQAEWGKEPVLAGCGGSIPVVGAFKHDLGMDTLMIGFGLEDDRMHSPNEKYELSSFHKGRELGRGC